jgi:ubiquitin carboxyl-terminal hydrolase 7
LFLILTLSLEQRFEEETAIKEARKRERDEAHLFMAAKVITDQTFKNYSGTDLCVFDANPETEPSAPRNYRVRRSMTLEDFVKQLAGDLDKDPRHIRLWLMVNRQNKTTRPDQPIMDLRPTIEEIYSRSPVTRDPSLRVWAEIADEVDASGDAVWPSWQSQPNGVVVKNDLLLLLLKYFDYDNQTLRGAGHIYISKERKVEELVPLIFKKMGWSEKAAEDEKLLLWEVRGKALSV